MNAEMRFAIMKHYSANELELYRKGKMSVLGKLQCAAHLKSCAECRMIFEKLKDEDRFIEELKYNVKIFSELAERNSISFSKKNGTSK